MSTYRPIHGIRIMTADERIVFERTGEEILGTNTLLEAKQMYDGLADKRGIQFRAYTECNKTYTDGANEIWSEMSLESFLAMV